MRVIGLIVMLLGFSASLSAETRMWTDEKGVCFEGEFRREMFGAVLVKDTKGVSCLIPFAKLSVEDLSYIRHHVSPTVEIDVDVRASVRPKTEWLVGGGDVTKDYTFFVTLKKTTQLPYMGRLTAELFVIAEERTKTRNERYVLMHYENSNVIFPQQKNECYEFASMEVPFLSYCAKWIEVPDAVERGKEYLGYVVVLLDSNRHVIAYETDVSGVKWLTEDIPYSAKKLRAFYKENAGSIHSRHFDESFEKRMPPRIPWYIRIKTF